MKKYIWNERKRKKVNERTHSSNTKAPSCKWLMSFKHGQQIKQVATDEYNGLRTARHRHDYCYIEGNTSTNYHSADPFRNTSALFVRVCGCMGVCVCVCVCELYSVDRE